MTPTQSLSKAIAISTISNQQQQQPTTSRTTIQLLVVGMKHNGVTLAQQKQLCHQQPGGIVAARFFLHREPDNAFDPYAIRVDYLSCQQSQSQNNNKTKKVGWIYYIGTGQTTISLAGQWTGGDYQ
jgi:hypothetical protein